VSVVGDEKQTNRTDIEGVPVSSTMNDGNIALLFSFPHCRVLGRIPALESFAKRLIAEKELPRVIASG